MPKVTHFDLLVDEPQRAIDFYSGVFGWEFTKWDGPMEYWLITTGPDDEPGIMGGMSRRNGEHFSSNLTISSKDVDADALNILKHGGKVTQAKHPIYHIGWLLSFRDSEGNVFGLMQDDPKAE